MFTLIRFSFPYLYISLVNSGIPSIHHSYSYCTPFTSLTSPKTLHNHRAPVLPVLVTEHLRYLLSLQHPVDAVPLQQFCVQIKSDVWKLSFCLLLNFHTAQTFLSVLGITLRYFDKSVGIFHPEQSSWNGAKIRASKVNSSYFCSILHWSTNLRMRR